MCVCICRVCPVNQINGFDPDVHSGLRVINDQPRRRKRNVCPKAMALLLLMMLLHKMMMILIRMQYQINYSIFIYLWSITAVMSYRHSIYSMWPSGAFQFNYSVTEECQSTTRRILYRFGDIFLCVRRWGIACAHQLRSIPNLHEHNTCFRNDKKVILWPERKKVDWMDLLWRETKMMCGAKKVRDCKLRTQNWMCTQDRPFKFALYRPFARDSCSHPLKVPLFTFTLTPNANTWTGLNATIHSIHCTVYTPNEHRAQA